MPGELDLAVEALRNAANAVPIEVLSSADAQLRSVVASIEQTGGGIAGVLLSSVAARRAEGDDLRKRLEALRQDLRTAAANVVSIGGGTTTAPPSGQTSPPRSVATPSAPPQQQSDLTLIAHAQAAGHKITPDAVVKIGRDTSGKLIWLEKGNEKGGLMHMNTGKRGGEFAQAGVAVSDIADVVFRAAATGTPVGITGRDRVVYATDHQGRSLLVAVTVGANGYIVGANPVHQSRKLKPLP